MLTVSSTLVDNKPQTSLTTRLGTPLYVKALPTLAPLVTITPSPKPTPSPITPFPPYLWQEIAVLQGQNRFLFNGSSQLPEIALTFDDGPNPYNTPQVLAVLQHYRIKATFFCIGRQVAAYPDLVESPSQKRAISGAIRPSCTRSGFVSTGKTVAFTPRINTAAILSS